MLTVEQLKKAYEEDLRKTGSDGDLLVAQAKGMVDILPKGNSFMQNVALALDVAAFMLKALDEGVFRSLENGGEFSDVERMLFYGRQEGEDEHPCLDEAGRLANIATRMRIFEKVRKREI